MSNRATGDGALRRAYTRSMPAVLRPLSLLAESMADVQAQWDEIIEGVAVANAASVGVRAAVRRVEQLASQLKAIKQELIPQMKKRNSCQLEGDSGEAYFLQYCTETASSVANVDSCVVVSADTQSELSEATRLAECVWVWCVCIGAILSDLELLSTSLSFAASSSLFDFDDDECGGTKCFRGRETSSFFFGRREENESSLSDGDVLLCCQLLYHLFTGDDAAAEFVFRRLVSLIDNCEVHVDGKQCRGCVLENVAQMANCVATDDYGALRLFMKLHIPAAGADNKVSVPALIVFFLQMMFDMVLRRRLLEGGFQNVWRPVIDTVDKPAVVAAQSNALTTALLSDLSRCSSVGGRRLIACVRLQHESSVLRGVWPIPESLVERYFHIAYKEVL